MEQEKKPWEQDYSAEVTDSKNNTDQGTMPWEQDYSESSPEKKNPVVSSSQDGSQGLQDSQQPLSREPEAGTAPLLQLPPVTDIVDIDLEKGVVKQSASKIDEQLESEAVKQAGLKPGEYKNSIFNASKMKDLGEVEAEIYIVDGQPVSGETLRDKLFDTKWVEEAQKRQHTIEINPKNNELVASLIDPEIVALAERNLQSGTRLGDKADMLLSGAYRAGAGVTGVNNLIASTFEEITGIPFTQNMDAMASKELSEELVEKAKKQEEKVFQYREGFVNSIMAGRYADAWQQGMNATAASIPYSATAAATTYAAGPVAAFAVLSPMGASSEFADMNISEDEAYKELSNAEKLARSYAVGTFEAGADMVAGRALTRSFDLGKSFWRGAVKEAFEKGGEGAAQKSAEEISKNIVKQHFKNIGLQGTEEYIAEGSSQMAQMFVDDLMGIREYSVQDYLRHGNEAGLIGAFSGVTMTSITGSPTVIASKGIDASQKIRGYYDNVLRKDPESVLSQIDDMAERGALAGVDANVIKANVESRAKAVKSVPEELVEDTETVDKVQKKQQLEEKKSELDPVFQGPVQEEIDGLTEEIVSRSKKEGVPAEVETTGEGVKKEITPTKTKADQEKAAPEQKVTPKEGIEPKNEADQTTPPKEETAPVTEESTPVEQKQEQDALQEQETESVPTREQAESGKEVGQEVRDKSEEVQEEKEVDSPEQIRSKITELVSQVDEAADNFELDRVSELNAQIDELSKKLPEETVSEQEFTEEEAAAAMEERESQAPKETMDEVEESFTPISIAEYEKYKGKGMYEENKKFLKGLVTEEGSSTPIDTRDKPNREDVEYFDPEDIIAYVDAVASDKAGKGFTNKRIPKEKRARKKQPTKRKVTADTLRSVAEKLRKGKPGADGRLLSDPTMLTPLVAAGMESAAKLMETSANILESEIVDHIVEYVRNHPSFKKLSATQRKALDLRKYVLDEIGMTYPEYIESLIKAQRKKESKAKTEGRKEGRKQERTKQKKKETDPDLKGELSKEGGKSPKRYTLRTVKALEKLSGKEALEQAIRDLGLKQETVQWKQVQPIASEIVEDIFSDPNNIDQKVNDLYNTITGTKQSEYIDNPQLSTLHALTFHMVLDRMMNEGMDDMYVKWNDTFQKIGASNGRFTSAMQRDASPYALMNLKIRPLFDGMNEALNTETETGNTRNEEIQKIKDLVDELIKSKGLITTYEKKVDELNKKLQDANKAQTLGFTPPAQQFTKKQQIRKKRKNALALIKQGLKESRGQANIGVPINDKLVNGLIQLISSYVEEGIYEAAKIKKLVMRNVESDITDDADSLIIIAEKIDEYLRSDDFSESRKDAMKEAFTESLYNMVKSEMGDTRAREKSAEIVLLQSLLQKMGETIGKSAKKGSKAYQERLRSAMDNVEFSDEVWKSAVANVKEWLNRQEMDPEQKAEILARIEDSASAFMETPFAKSDIRQAIRDGEKDLGMSIRDIVKKHWTTQNKALQTLAEKLVYDLGLNAETAKQYEQAIIEEARSYLNEKRLSAVRQQLNLDKNGKKKERADRVNRRVIDRIIEAINLGVLDDDAFRGFFAEKYGIIKLTPQDIRAMKNFNDLIHMHEGTDISKRYTKDLADYIETLKPWTAARVMAAIESVVVKGMLTGLSTITTNIPVGSVLSYAPNIIPSIISNPAVFAKFLSEYSKAGLSGTSRRTFLDIMKDGYSPMEDGATSKFEEKDIYGDPIDYMLRNYAPKKEWEKVTEAKDVKEAAKKFAYMLAKTYAQTYRLANFARAFDVLISTRGTEFDLFLKYFNEESKKAGHPLRGRFDPTVSKKFIDSVREKMGYDPDTIKESEEAVDNQIAGMKARGERVGRSFRQNLIRELIAEKRDAIDAQHAKERVTSFLLMDHPTGLGSYIYDTVTRNLTIQENAPVPIAAGKLASRLVFGLFFRISVTSIQRAIENIPIAGLATPGIFYDRVPSDPLNPKSPKQWMTFKNELYDKSKMQRRLLTHATVTALSTLVAMNMFRAEDYEEEEEQEDGSFKIVKKTRITLNPDRIFEVTGHSGEFFKTEQFNRKDDERKDYYFRVKINGKWRNAVPIWLAPQFLFSSAVLGGMADDIKFNPDQNKKKREQIMKGLDDMFLASTQMSFQTIPRSTRQIYYGFEKSPAEGALKIGELVARPFRTAYYPNAYRDLYKETRFLMGKDEKIAKGIASPFTNDFPYLEDYMGESVYDIFGYPKKTTSKLIEGMTNVPGVGLAVDNYIDYTTRNKERFESEAWDIKMKYFPNTEIKGYWPSGFDYETKTEASRIYGEIFRDRIVKNKEFISKKTQEEMDVIINGRESYDGTRSGGLHSIIVKEVKKQMGIDKLREAKKDEFKKREFIRKQIDGEYNEDDMKKMLDSFAKTVKERKELEELLKPTKR